MAKEMFMGQSSKIFSAFHLGYNMLINLLRLEGADPDYMIQRSFHQFQKLGVTLFFFLSFDVFFGIPRLPNTL